MASDLRIAIATHGAVWSHKMNDATKNLGKQTDSVKVGSGSAGKESAASKGIGSLVVLLLCPSIDEKKKDGCTGRSSNEALPGEGPVSLV